MSLKMKVEGKKCGDDYPIPPKYLNSMGFINYDHLGKFPWEETREKVIVPDEWKGVTNFLALDCEMVGISEEFDDRELARVSVVNEYGYCLLDTFAKPTVPVVSYCTKWSGVTAADLEFAPSVDEVRETVKKLVWGKILVGHSIHGDLDVLKMQNYPTNLLRDTADFYRYRYIPGEARNPALRQLTRKYLDTEIQNGSEGHSPIQDSQAAMKLYLINRFMWEMERRESIQKANDCIYAHAGTTAHPSIVDMNVNPEKKDLFVDSRTVYLRPNKIVGSYESSQDYVDCQFRLLLEDFLRPLRDGVQVVSYKNRQRYKVERLFTGVSVELFESGKAGKKKSQGFLGNVKVPIDKNKLRDVDWKLTKMFLNGSLVVLSADNFSSIHFGIIESLSEKSTLPESHLLFIRVKFSKNSDKISIQKEKFHMMESRAFFEAYKHTLEYLQIVDLDTFPLRNYIVNAQTYPVQPMRLVRKVYDERKLVEFGVLLKNDDPDHIINSMKINPFNEHHWPSADDLDLDESQHLALKQAITQEFTIIQGPPGCGKTFMAVQIIKLLLTNPWMLDDTPIMIVSYTNHALDQLLERVFRFYSDHFCAGDDKKASLGMIRIGGCSESEQMKELTLLNKSKQKQMANKATKLLLQAEMKMDSLMFLKRLFKKDPWLIRSGILNLSEWNKWMTQSQMDDIIKRCKKAHIAPGSGIDYWSSEVFKKNPSEALGVNGLCAFKKVKEFLVPSSKLYVVLQRRFGIAFVSDDQIVEKICLTTTEDLRNLSEEDLQFLQVWINYLGTIKCIRDFIEAQESNITALRNQLAAIGPAQTKSQHIQSAKIIGMTTTGAVKYKEMILKSFKPRVMLVEEAAHVLEAHVVASLTEHCEQLILIGDHKQLRPMTADNSLAWRYKLDVSLMERLVRNGIDQGRRNWVQLKVQHRMRPEIAKMVCPLIYKELRNHPDVEKYEKVKGCRKNLFFIDHDFPEEKDQGCKSFHNVYEINIVKALVKFFVENGHYSPSRITVIATYKAQRDKIETQLRESQNSDLETVRISTVDGYQGEENDIVILSLVRSNDEERIGFLKTNNRLCVALSRARHGFFMTGNMSCLAGAAENWQILLETLKDMDAIGCTLDMPLYGAKENILQNLKQPPMPKKVIWNPQTTSTKNVKSYKNTRLKVEKLSSQNVPPVFSTPSSSPKLQAVFVPKCQLLKSPSKLSQNCEDKKCAVKMQTTTSYEQICVHNSGKVECKSVAEVIIHKICNHKVVVRCCDLGRESSLWCDKNTPLICHSCGWIKRNKTVKCRTILQGQHKCPQCNMIIKSTKDHNQQKDEKPTVSKLPEALSQNSSVLPQKQVPTLFRNEALSYENIHLRMEKLSIQGNSKVLPTSSPKIKLQKPSACLPNSPVSTSPTKKYGHKCQPNGCEVVVKVIQHKICDHKVVVRCCDVGRESSLWCQKYTKPNCSSCGWAQKSNVRCSSVILGLLNCPQCSVKIKLKTEKISDSGEMSTAPELPKIKTTLPQVLPQAEIQKPVALNANLKSPQTKEECSKVFKCGHRCHFDGRKEHSAKHLNYRCNVQCSRICQKGHKCPTRHQCYTLCPSTTQKYGCQQPMHDFVFQCGHTTGATLKCGQVSQKSLKKLLVKKRCSKCG